ncbi:hypothetical protein LOAG_11385 [Loa loa]|nr:hypothetical protein LOAG_11385 [Loa loa]EFO17116.2 hypothetical protein LOAG_11385 [Loa loa]
MDPAETRRIQRRFDGSNGSSGNVTNSTKVRWIQWIQWKCKEFNEGSMDSTNLAEIR